eukprot:CAMPEP_0206250760 /NCGR_PEP_ID=MMETSP0047_2-20121206/21653_1 /ASSEMBLY_ACC=CAM_ASM_000192 /TAXON_ID=195065 /ORGANISM="Chroomonas mesostigmatica_cf, Strain CCMP1168" /LENGTH=219 /DNA_ID=CAMNT_0053676649 /DNA_START=63 /DNA_END=722 /DNA_ORIENTATION=-
MSAAEKRQREREKAARKTKKTELLEEKDNQEESEEESEEEEDDGLFSAGPDPRIEQLKEYISAGHTPEEIAAELERLGGVDALVCGAMIAGRGGEDFAKGHFLISCLLDQGGKLTEEIVSNKAIFKACFAGTSEGQLGILTAMELYIVTEKRNGIKVFDKVCKTLWECDIVEEDQFKVWQAQETALQAFYAEFKLGDAIKMREAASTFLDWLEEGEEEG